MIGHTATVVKRLLHERGEYHDAIVLDFKIIFMEGRVCLSLDDLQAAFFENETVSRSLPGSLFFQGVSAISCDSDALGEKVSIYEVDVIEGETLLDINIKLSPAGFINIKCTSMIEVV